MNEPSRDFGYVEHRSLLRSIIAAYDSPIVRAYSFVRFVIININILHILHLCMKGKKRVLEIGCGFGLFGCYFALRDPEIQYHGIDLDEGRIGMAREAASRLGATNVRFETGDARGALDLEDEYDAILMMDLLHHLPAEGKASVLEAVTSRLSADGRLVIKEITRQPRWKLFFTWLLDVLMTGGFDMWYWDPADVRKALGPEFDLEIYPIADWLPYPHVVYLLTRSSRDASREQIVA